LRGILRAVENGNFQGALREHLSDKGHRLHLGLDFPELAEIIFDSQDHPIAGVKITGAGRLQPSPRFDHMEHRGQLVFWAVGKPIFSL
jgi:hypothetical protein